MQVTGFFKNECKNSVFLFLTILLKSLFYYIFYKKKIIANYNVKIIGFLKINIPGILKIGLHPSGFVNNNDKTFLNIQGNLIFGSSYSIASGCRLDVGPNAILKFGKGGFVNSFTTFIIMHGLEIGDNCSISWNCQFLDEDFHEIVYEEKKKSENNNIKVGNHVWVGCNVFIYKSTTIANGCVIAANSVLRGSFLEENCLIAGNPAKVIKKNVLWK